MCKREPSEWLEQCGLSTALQNFIAQDPEVRSGILSFLQVAAKWTSKSAILVDLGAGSSPFRELFDVAQYIAVDWNENAPSAPFRIDVQASADNVPLQDRVADVIIMTELLEHSPRPAETLREARRLMKPGARIFGTTPFAWEFHERPHDYFRYTPSAITSLCHQVGLQVISIEERGSTLDVLKVLGRKIAYAFRDDSRLEMQASIATLSEAIDTIHKLGREASATHQGFPLGLSFVAARPMEKE